MSVSGWPVALMWLHQGYQLDMACTNQLTNMVLQPGRGVGERAGASSIVLTRAATIMFKLTHARTKKNSHGKGLSN